MPYREKSADELVDAIYQLVERLVSEGPAEGRHDRANLGNEIVLIASVLRQRARDCPPVSRDSSTTEASSPEPVPAEPPRR